MPAYKEKERKTWYVSFRYKTTEGESKRAFKRGFASKKDAILWEQEYRLKEEKKSQMSFQSLYELYMEDIRVRCRQSSFKSKEYLFRDKILPFFSSRIVNDITAGDVRLWQNTMMKRGYSPTYLKTINNQLCAIFNYGVRFCGLSENPCHKAGSMGKKNAGEMMFWTKEEFSRFIQSASDPTERVAFRILYWTGIRIGEFLALTPADFDFEKQTLTIDKSYQRIAKEDYITAPKTEKGMRVITIQKSLCLEVANYLSTQPQLSQTDRIFPFTRFRFERALNRLCKASGVKRIRLHDIRHSHASLLVELGYQPKLIADRLGHEKIQTTLDTYSHLYPNKQREVAERLQLLEL